MALINPALIADEHFEYLEGNFDLSVYDDEVDMKIHAVCMGRGVVPSDIPVDESGYVTSIPLIVYGKLLYKYLVFCGYWGKRNGNNDIYYDKKNDMKGDMADAKSDITKSTICGWEEDATQVGGGFDQIQVRPY